MNKNQGCPGKKIENRCSKNQESLKKFFEKLTINKNKNQVCPEKKLKIDTRSLRKSPCRIFKLL